MKRAGHRNADIQITDGIICAGLEDEKDACFGDSCGPLVIPLQENGNGPFHYYQIGIVSWGFPVAKAGMPTIYTSVQYHVRKWK